VSAGPHELSPTGGEVRYFALLYDVVDDFVERRAPYREAHLASSRRLTAGERC
jgi:hypothetical protein